MDNKNSSLQKNKLTITKEFEFDSSHRLVDVNLTEEENRDIFGKCFNSPSHGHLYKLFVEVSSINPLRHGMIINFCVLKEIVNEVVIEEYDHHFLNDCESLSGIITTCENMIQVIWDRLASKLVEEGCQLESLKLYETPTSCATLER